MAPALRALSDGQPRSGVQVRQLVASEVGITEDDLLEVIKSGTPVFDSRVSWALTCMAQAGLVRRPKRGVNQITERGQQVLRDHPERIDNHVLQAFETRVKTPTSQPGTPPPARQPVPAETVASAATPRETITAAVEENNAAVAPDLLERVRAQDPIFLEHLVLKVLTAMGDGGAAGSAEQLGKSGDEGWMVSSDRTRSDSTASTFRPSATPRIDQ